MKKAKKTVHIIVFIVILAFLLFLIPPVNKFLRTQLISDLPIIYYDDATFSSIATDTIGSTATGEFTITDVDTTTTDTGFILLGEPTSDSDIAIFGFQQDDVALTPVFFCETDEDCTGECSGDSLSILHNVCNGDFCADTVCPTSPEQYYCAGPGRRPLSDYEAGLVTEYELKFFGDEARKGYFNIDSAACVPASSFLEGEHGQVMTAEGSIVVTSIGGVTSVDGKVVVDGTTITFGDTASESSLKAKILEALDKFYSQSESQNLNDNQATLAVRIALGLSEDPNEVDPRINDMINKCVNEHPGYTPSGAIDISGGPDVIGGVDISGGLDGGDSGTPGTPGFPTTTINGEFEECPLCPGKLLWDVGAAHDMGIPTHINHDGPYFIVGQEVIDYSSMSWRQIVEPVIWLGDTTNKLDGELDIRCCDSDSPGVDQNGLDTFKSDQQKIVVNVNGIGTGNVGLGTLIVAHYKHTGSQQYDFLVIDAIRLTRYGEYTVFVNNEPGRTSPDLLNGEGYIRVIVTDADEASHGFSVRDIIDFWDGTNSSLEGIYNATSRTTKGEVEDYWQGLDCGGNHIFVDPMNIPYCPKGEQIVKTLIGPGLAGGLNISFTCQQAQTQACATPTSITGGAGTFTPPPTTAPPQPQNNQPYAQYLSDLINFFKQDPNNNTAKIRLEMFYQFMLATLGALSNTPTP